MPVVSSVEHNGSPSPHTAQEDRHIQRLGNFAPEFVGRGQDATCRLTIVAQVKNHLQSVHPVFAPHFFNRNDPSSFDHFFYLHYFVLFKSIYQKFGLVLEFF
jgi:hypothetical protein